MKILVAGQNYRLVGGSDRYMLELIRLLNKNNFCAIPFAAQHPENDETEWSKYFPKTADFSSPGIRDAFEYVYSNRARASISALIKDVSPDIAHLNIYYGKLTTSIIKELKSNKIPIIQTLHEYKTVCPVYSLQRDGNYCDACKGGEFWRATYNKCNRGSLIRSALTSVESYVSRINGDIANISKFITVSDFQKSTLTSLGLPAQKTVTIHNFTTPDESIKRAPQGYFIFFGRVEREKGIYTAIHAANKGKLNLKIVGTGSELERAKNFARETPNIEFLGHKSGDELKDLIRNATCTIFPSECLETFGLVAIESLAVGTPVIASKIGAIPEVISHGVNGFLFPPGDSESLASLCKEIASNPEAANTLGRTGHKIVKENFSPTSHLEKLRRIYASLT